MCKLNFSTYYYPINIFRIFNFQPHLSLFDYVFACNANSHQPFQFKMYYTTCYRSNFFYHFQVLKNSKTLISTHMQLVLKMLILD